MCLQCLCACPFDLPMCVCPFDLPMCVCPFDLPMCVCPFGLPMCVCPFGLPMCVCPFGLSMCVRPFGLHMCKNLDTPLSVMSYRYPSQHMRTMLHNAAVPACVTITTKLREYVSGWRVTSASTSSLLAASRHQRC